MNSESILIFPNHRTKLRIKNHVFFFGSLLCLAGPDADERDGVRADDLVFLDTVVGRVELVCRDEEPVVCDDSEGSISSPKELPALPPWLLVPAVLLELRSTLPSPVLFEEFDVA